MFDSFSDWLRYGFWREFCQVDQTNGQQTGMFPGCFYLIGMWYKRSEAQKRFSFFFSSTSLAGAFSGLLAAALSNMNGVRGYNAWRWVFIIEGLLTVVVSFLFFFIIPDFPENSKFLSEREREYVKRRIEEDQGKAALERPITFRDVVNVFKDFKVGVTLLWSSLCQHQ